MVNRFRNFLVALLLLPMLAVAAPQGPVIGRITLFLGDVQGIDQDGDTFVVRRGADLHAGYSFDTGPRSFVRAQMNDGTTFTLSQNGSASLDSFSFNATARTGGLNSTVKRGGFRYQSGQLGDFGSNRVHSLINTPSGEIGVRGTVIEAKLAADGQSLIISVPVGNITLTVTRSDGSSQFQNVGQDAVEEAVSVLDGDFSELSESDAAELQTEINTLINLVNEVEATITGEGDSDDSDEEEEERDEEEADEEGEEGDTVDGEDEGQAVDEDAVLSQETEADVAEAAEVIESLDALETVTLDTESDTATIKSGGGVSEEEVSVSTVNP